MGVALSERDVLEERNRLADQIRDEKLTDKYVHAFGTHKSLSRPSPAWSLKPLTCSALSFARTRTLRALAPLRVIACA